MPSVGYSHMQKQEQRISSSLIQGLNMLSLPAQAMYDYLVELSMANPMLEIPEPPAADRYENISPAQRKSEAGLYDEAESGYAAHDEDFDPYYSRGADFEADGLDGSLKLQLSMCRLSAAERAIGLEIIGDLDDSGYFVGNLETICLLYRSSMETGKKVLSLIHGFQPKGIAARDVYEALCLQVEDSFPYPELARRIIREELRALCEGESGVTACAAKYGAPAERVRRCFDYIRTLEPRPGNCGERPLQINYIIPDIVVKKTDGELLVYVSGEAENPLRVNDYYLELLRRPGLGADEKRYLRQSLNSATALIHSVDIRRQTIHRAALSLVSLQGDFFRGGPKLLRPLTMRQLADDMGVNVSTVSRVVQDKYVSTPWGIFPLKYFFVRALKGADETEVSAEAAKTRIAELINAEDAASPLTDDELCAALGREGYPISRRTVSKYRQAAGIPGCLKRRRGR
ncbi:MAG: RNA polymerase factor sigma-54 [Oscillospiraceae bacterium]|nr:RNA polymerase factor sigma-54 [Oscillospiraceae bacterium]